MALPLPLKFPITSSSSSSSPSCKAPRQFRFGNVNNSVTLKLNISNGNRNRSGNFTIINAIEKNREENELSEIQQTDELPESETKPGEVTELGMEIKKAMEDRRKKENETGGDFWSGVLEEVKEIEWPAFGKVIGTTGVVLGVIAGSSVVLLTLNAVLAELSDRVFAGKGVQDFFG